MATTKATLVARRIKFILEKLEREIEYAESSHQEALQKCVTVVHEALRKYERRTLH